MKTDFFYEWGDSAMIVTSDGVTGENHQEWQNQYAR